MTATVVSVPGRRTPEAAPPARRYPLDTIRAGAALFVVVFHAYQNQWNSAITKAPGEHSILDKFVFASDSAVDLFFVISGFLLFLPVVRAAMSGAAPRSGRDLLRRRMIRLLPLYFVTVFLVWGVSNTELPGHWQDLLLHLTMTHVYSQDYIFWTNGPAWSLAVEFHFYVLMALAAPVIGRVCLRLPSRRARWWTVAALPLLLLAIGVGWIAWATATGVSHGSWPAWFGPQAKAAMFALGMGLAMAVVAGAQLRRRWVRIGLASAGFVAVWWLTDLRLGSEVSAGWIHLGLAVVGVTWIAVVVLSPDRPARVLTWRPAVFLGTVSYGIYLLHEPIMRLLRHLGLLPAIDGGTYDFLLTAAIVIAVTVAAAWLSFTTIEAGVLKLLYLRDGSSRREYYPHLLPDGRPPVGRRPDPATDRLGTVQR